MAFIDEIKIYAEAGRGGDGVVRWRQEKFIPKGGPAGGDGGRGGDFYAVAIRDVHILSKYKAKKSFKAQKGENGGNKSLHGKKGNDFVLELPIGSIITNLETEEKWQLLEEREKILLLKGGHGGFGNEHFKSSTNTTPKEWRPGEEGERGNFHIELELFADAGLVGLPNAGKTSLLNAITNTNAKVGDYEFTTLDPNLGDFYGHTIADIPGLIEGANLGKGLGVKFLRHIKRTKMIAHLISFENLFKNTTGMMKAYKEIRKELEKYDKNLNLGEEGLSKKEEIIILTKSDTTDNSKIIEKKKKEFEKISKKVFVLSLYDDKSIKTFRDELVKILKKKV
ncbi:MAG: GTPase obg [Candidatus Nomurabacteria bacterium GW2011_GWB1_35_20]|uniref:GTPase Obg n=2 Tax=Candidatus Nomuraibacteriota TaxID=1752729 RepID=A0A0G0DY03_9BACT|nr:MAG: GTPase obg [Candidatus Nomurabacteria bacterium GW2011_GWB1_35_20]KKP76414.1 MAG: GTPase obg [Parcubacteria group bacterium GW2011_GWC1_35_21]KKP77534.1 MAG: GTPase obg [Candidatus Nomurabacteria bacterium GW2011_GWC2_35_35]KKP98078.1 MAG: GTPase obg [Candidatus Nomurabacteria bacterium GW2011_GWA1_36_15]HCY17862.1 GTPase ObgE [Candidatus Nomurabacteria bacterium]